ncbi:MAG: peptidylprolyl isomerase [Alistipes sp.]|nr:peptidylprolyl isomerase [Alistipes sp.]
MKVEQNKMVAVDYTLTVDGKIADRSQPGKPLEFICGMGMLLPKFEAAIMGKEPGEKVAFTLEAKDGYGEVIPEAVVELPKTVFMMEGKIAEEILFVGSQIPMADAQGNRMVGVVREVKADSIMMDFNHPMAGKTLNFEVEVVSVRDVTPEDLASQGGCGCGCHDCDGDCGGEHECHGDHDCGGEHECKHGHHGEHDHGCDCGCDHK